MDSEPIRTSIIRIGNSQGVRLPKAVLAISGIEHDVEIAVTEGVITIRAAKKARKDWAEYFQAMAASGDDVLFDEPISTQWDEEDWEWK